MTSACQVEEVEKVEQVEVGEARTVRKSRSFEVAADGISQPPAGGLRRRPALIVLACWCLAASMHGQQPELPPPPGKLIEVGGRPLHLHCTGQGQPTVVFEAGGRPSRLIGRSFSARSPPPLGRAPTTAPVWDGAVPAPARLTSTRRVISTTCWMPRVNVRRSCWSAHREGAAGPHVPAGLSGPRRGTGARGSLERGSPVHARGWPVEADRLPDTGTAPVDLANTPCGSAGAGASDRCTVRSAAPSTLQAAHQAGRAPDRVLARDGDT